MPACHALIFDDRVLPGSGDVIVLELREWTLILAVVRRDVPFQHDLGICGRFEVDGLALHEARGLAQISAGDLEFVETVGRGGSGGGVVERVMADEDCNRHRLVSLLVFEVVLPRVARVEEDAGFVRPLDLQAMKADVSLTGIGILADDQAGTDHRAAVAPAGHVNRQFGEVELFPPELDLLDRRIGNPDWRNATAHAVGHERHESILACAKGESRMAHVGRGLTQGAPAVRQVLEQQRLLAALVEQGAHLGQRIDRLVDSDELPGGLQIGNPCAHVLWARIRSHASFRFVDRVYSVRSKHGLPPRCPSARTNNGTNGSVRSLIKVNSVRTEIRYSPSSFLHRGRPLERKGTGEMMKACVMTGIALVAATSIACAEDLAAGAIQFKKCAPCHDVGETAKNKIGPVLNGLDGRKSGTVPSFKYSEANKGSGIVWDEAQFLDY